MSSMACTNHILCLLFVITVFVTRVMTEEAPYLNFNDDDAIADDSIESGDINHRTLTTQSVSNRIAWASYFVENNYGSYLTIPSSNPLPARLPATKRHYYMGFGSPNYSYRTCSDITESDCRFIEHCPRSEYLNSFDTFLSNACPIGKDYIGVCCRKTKTTTTTETTAIGISAQQPPSPNNTTTNKRPLPEIRKRCGVHCCKITAKIVGGTPVEPNEWPWMVALLRGETDRLCGGVLITDQHVLTAASCIFSFQPSDLTARLGEYDFRVNSSSERDYAVEKFVMHENYDRRKFHNNIALLKLTEKVIFTNDVRPICLPDQRMQLEGQRAYVIGWGATLPFSDLSDVLLEVQLPISKQSVCKEAYNEFRINITDNELCAGGVAGEDACQGDSGGPLMVQDPKTLLWQVAGIVSFGKGCGEEGKPGVYTRVAPYNNWIKENVFHFE